MSIPNKEMTHYIDNNIPDNTAIKYNVTNILIFSIISLLDLNNTSNATPLPVNNPDIQEDKLIILFIYNSVIITDEPQLGINPIKLVKNTDNILLLLNKLSNNSSPPQANIMFNINVTIKIKPNILKV